MSLPRRTLPGPRWTCYLLAGWCVTLSAEGQPAGPVTCVRHRDVPTLLRCSRCDTPICPKCLVHSPVGARCPDCASPLRPLAPSRAQYVGAAAAGMAVGFAGGALLGFGGLGGLGLLIVGFAVGEVVSRAGGRRGGTALAWIAFSVAVVGPLLARAMVLGLVLPVPDPSLRLAAAAQVLIPLLLSGDGLFLAIAGVIAAARAH